ncbi:solute carrier family 35 member F2-like isoform X1 [Centruroides vittatus]|uniref:solute carrier family 35 member F2-like isoform X1 n=1 Tax=Centruroides vittatus TaxID=120091 RepID=UPI00351074CA
MDGDIQRDYDEESTSSSRRSATLARRICAYFSQLGKWEVWNAIILGQFLSLLLCGTGVTSQLLHSTYMVKVPTAQSFLNYVLLCMVFTTWLACRSGDRGLIPILRARGWKYFLLAAVDVEANYLLVKAYQYTTLTSVQLLDCFTIPTVLALSWIFLKVRYKILHVLGVGIALLGVGCLVWADSEEGKTQRMVSNRLLGDMLCLSGAALYGISNVAEEFVVKTYNQVEFLGMLGLFGSVVNGIQLAVLERQEVAVINWEKWQEVSLLLGFAGCLFLLYITMPVVMRVSSATAVNLSILSADFYSLIIGLYIFDFKFHWLYSLSFVLVVTGVIVYSVKPTPIATAHYREMSAGEMQGDVELANQTPCSTVTYNSVGSTRDESGRELVWNKAATVVSVSHSVSVHARDQDEPNLDRRNGSAGFLQENGC